jgi:4-hydroxy-4-methyl-2-oxoglutarate aldolase
MTNTLPTRLAALDSCAVSDALDSLGLPPAVVGLPPLSVAERIAGPVLTVKLAAGRAADGGGRHLGTAAIEAASRGDIIVIEHSSGAECAGWGGVLSAGARVNGVAGVIIDGPARDIDEARALQFPVYGRSAIARTARGRAYEQDFNGPVTIGGVGVAPGDFALADSSGVVFVPRDRLEEVVRRAERIAERERLMIHALRKGERITVVVGRDYEQMLDELAE